MILQCKYIFQVLFHFRPKWLVFLSFIFQLKNEIAFSVLLLFVCKYKIDFRSSSNRDATLRQEVPEIISETYLLRHNDIAISHIRILLDE